MNDITKIGLFYRKRSRIILLISLFITFLLCFLFLDLKASPYPPQVSFQDGNNYIMGDIYIDGEFYGTMEKETFTMLPDSYCLDHHTISLDTELETFFWTTEPEHCTVNSIVFEVSR